MHVNIVSLLYFTLLQGSRIAYTCVPAALIIGQTSHNRRFPANSLVPYLLFADTASSSPPTLSHTSRIANGEKSATAAADESRRRSRTKASQPKHSIAFHLCEWLERNVGLFWCPALISGLEGVGTKPVEVENSGRQPRTYTSDAQRRHDAYNSSTASTRGARMTVITFICNKLCRKPRYMPPPLCTVRPSSSPYTPYACGARRALLPVAAGSYLHPILGVVHPLLTLTRPQTVLLHLGCVYCSSGVFVHSVGF